jgi:hypothetical protein
MRDRACARGLKKNREAIFLYLNPYLTIFIALCICLLALFASLRHMCRRSAKWCDRIMTQDTAQGEEGRYEKEYQRCLNSGEIVPADPFFVP